ncbi:DNA mismatch repair protein [Oleoguttula sp. CCFEE 5521]
MGVRPCDAAGGNSEIYDCINKIFENSSFGVVEDEHEVPDEAELLRRQRDRRFKMDGHTLRSTRGTKGVDRWPMFVLQIRHTAIKPGPLKSIADSGRELSTILDMLDAMVRQWLTSQGCRLHKKRRRANDMSENTAARQRDSSDTGPPVMAASNDAAPFRDTVEKNRPSTADSLSRIKAGRRNLLDVWETRKPRTAPDGQTGTTRKEIRIADNPRLRSLSSFSPTHTASHHSQSENAVYFDGSGKTLTLLPQSDTLSSDCFGSISDSDLLAAVRDAASEPSARQVDSAQTCDDHTTAWTDPCTGQAFTINTRTGIVLPTCQTSKAVQDHSLGSGCARQSAAMKTATTSTGRPLTLARRGDSARRAARIQQTYLPNWKNPIFEKPSECQIPVTLVNMPGEDTGGFHCAHFHSGAQTNVARETDRQSSITKSALRSAVVMRQVDRKYILARLPRTDHTTGDTTEMLIIIDQHAASERVILED